MAMRQHDVNFNLIESFWGWYPNSCLFSAIENSPYSKKIWPPPPDVGDVNLEAQRLAADAIQRAAYHVHAMYAFLFILFKEFCL